MKKALLAPKIKYHRCQTSCKRYPENHKNIQFYIFTIDTTNQKMAKKNTVILLIPKTSQIIQEKIQ